MAADCLSNWCHCGVQCEKAKVQDRALGIPVFDLSLSGGDVADIYCLEEVIQTYKRVNQASAVPPMPASFSR